MSRSQLQNGEVDLKKKKAQWLWERGSVSLKPGMEEATGHYFIFIAIINFWIV